MAGLGQAFERPGRRDGRRLDVDAQLDARAHTYRNAARVRVAQLVSTQVTVDNNASDTATVVEVRAEDIVGQLHRITRALVECHLDVTSAKVSTFGSAVVDAFYVRGPDGRKLTEPPGSPPSNRPSTPSVGLTAARRRP